MDKLIKIVLAGLCFLCLLDLPYGFYQFVRLAGLIGFIYLAYHANQNSQQNIMILYVCLAILFQPLIKISLGRTIWNIVDVIVGVGLLSSLIIKSRK